MRQGPWTDVYALAAVVYFAIIGKAPQASISRYMSDGLKPAARLAAGRYSDGFLRAIDQALSVKPNGRPQSVDEFRALLGLGDRRSRPRATAPSLAPPSAAPLPEAIAAATPESLMRTEPHTPTVLPPAAPASAPAAVVVPPAVSTPAPARPAIKVEIKESGPLKVYLLTGILLLGFVAFLVWMYKFRAPPTPEIPARPSPAPQAPTVTPPELRKAPDLAPRPAEPAPVSEPAAPPAQAPAAPPAEAIKPVEPAPPPAVVPQPPAPVPTPVALTSAELFEQILAGRDTRRLVTAAADSAQVGIGRGTARFSVGSSAPGYLYVLKLAAGTEDIVLVFPNLADQKNRIGPEKQLVQPSATWSKPAEGPPGVDRYVAIVSDQPRDFGMLDARPRGAFKVFQADSLARLQRGYAGAAPLLAGKAVCPVGESCSQDYGAAAFSVERIVAPAADPKNLPQPREPAPVDKRPAAAAKEKEKEKERGIARTPSSEKSSAKITVPSDRCSDILERASLGEALSPEKMSYLKKECGR